MPSGNGSGKSGGSNTKGGSSKGNSNKGGGSKQAVSRPGSYAGPKGAGGRLNTAARAAGAPKVNLGSIPTGRQPVSVGRKDPARIAPTSTPKQFTDRIAPTTTPSIAARPSYGRGQPLGGMSPTGNELRYAGIGPKAQQYSQYRSPPSIAAAPQIAARPSYGRGQPYGGMSPTPSETRLAAQMASVPQGELGPRSPRDSSVADAATRPTTLQSRSLIANIPVSNPLANSGAYPSRAQKQFTDRLTPTTAQYVRQPDFVRQYGTPKPTIADAGIRKPTSPYSPRPSFSPAGGVTIADAGIRKPTSPYQPAAASGSFTWGGVKPSRPNSQYAFGTTVGNALSSDADRTSAPVRPAHGSFSWGGITPQAPSQAPSQTAYNDPGGMYGDAPTPITGGSLYGNTPSNGSASPSGGFINPVGSGGGGMGMPLQPQQQTATAGGSATPAGTATQANSTVALNYQVPPWLYPYYSMLGNLNKG